MKIDMVYLWVNGNDPVWRARKEAFIRGEEYVPGEANLESRFVDNDELKYSLRSVEACAPWINHIYIVTDNQVPSWLNVDNPRVSVVDHKQILPAEALPTYSSPAIEWCIDRIPGLSEHFLYANDDTLFAQPAEPGFFFNDEGLPIIRMKPWASSHRHLSLYMKTIVRAKELIYAHYGKRYKCIPHHNIDGYRLSHLKEFKQQFASLVEPTVMAHFRREDDLQRSAFFYYALATGRGRLKMMGRYNRAMPLWKKVIETLHSRFYYDSRTIDISRLNFDKVLQKYHPVLFCMNDNEKADDHCRVQAKAFLDGMFPRKCSFER